MKEEQIKKLTDEELIKKEKSSKMMSGLLFGISIPLLIFGISDVMNGKGVDVGLVMVVLLWITIPFTHSETKKLQAEKARREKG